MGRKARRLTMVRLEGGRLAAQAIRPLPNLGSRLVASRRLSADADADVAIKTAAKAIAILFNIFRFLFPKAGPGNPWAGGWTFALNTRNRL
jgi:hypothetical protein